jgi:O-glycosyl hydrolase
MAIKLNDRGYAHAKKLIGERKVELDQRDDWSEHQPTAEQENRFIEEHGMNAYARWHLGVDDEAGEDTKGHYKFPYGDFEKVHRCGVLAAESRAGQYGYTEIELATAHLHGALDALM